MTDFLDLERETRRIRRRYRHRILIISAIVLIAILSLGGLALCQSVRTCGFSGLARAGMSGECYGITDGAFVFDPKLAEIEDLIKAQNDAVTASGEPYVSVAYYTPMTFGPGDTTTPVSTRHSLEGAYVAQMRANTTAVIGTAPKIRLLLANPGSTGAHWKPVVKQLVDRTRTSDHLVAVAGLGTSTTNTESALQALAREHIAMIGSVITSTQFADTAIYPGLVRVAPTNDDEVRALINYLPAGVMSALLVQDKNTVDDYVHTLGEAFGAGFPASHQGRRMTGQVEVFDSSLANAGDRFSQIADAACQENPDMIFFAGRGVYLTDFLKALGHRHCDDAFLVLSGDDTTHVTVDDEVADALRGVGQQQPITMIYSALAHPDEWQKVGFIGYDNFRDEFRAHPSISGDLLDDGQAMMAHDAVLTAVAAIRGPLAQAKQVPLPSTQQVVQNLAGLHLDNSVRGASGMITINGSSGSPINKPVPILRLAPTGAVSFVQVSWPDGHPPAASGG